MDGVEVLEVGPGPGGLTRALLSEGAKKVVAIERDPRCLPALAEIAAHYPGRLEIIEGDALEIDPTLHLRGPSKIVSNLPYNVGTRLLTGWLSAEAWPPWWSSLTLMFQKEVADRIVAKSGSKAYGRLSVLAQVRATAVSAFDLPARAFTPPPKVTSAVVHITPSEAPSGVPINLLEQLTAAGFGQRRKMLRQSLKGLTEDPTELIKSAGIEPTVRGETLALTDWLALTRAYLKSRKT